MLLSDMKTSLIIDNDVMQLSGYYRSWRTEISREDGL
tara:strand:+ start:1359 stop:1469 length:111 start_codon:yes stop_codon:yes gene_type:complete